MSIFAASTQSPLGTNSDRALASARFSQSGGCPRVLLLHQQEDSAQAIQNTLLPLCSRLQVINHPDQAQACLTRESWDVLVVHLDSQENSGLETLRFAQGSGLLLARIALLDSLDPFLLAAAIPLELHALMLPPLAAPFLRQTIERCYVNVLRQRQEARAHASTQEQILQLKENRKKLLTEMENLESSVMDALLASLAMRETDCVLHALRVQAYASYFARLVHYPQSLLPHLERAALLHDIGKIGLSDALLFRPGVFSPTDVERMQSHAAVGEQILNRIHFLRPAAQIVRHHHERFDGLGFPDGLSGENIPLGSRIFSIIDTLDAMTSDRPYRPAQSYEKALQELERCAGTHFDPRLTATYAQVPSSTWAQIRRNVEDAYASRSASFYAGNPSPSR